MIAIVSDIHGRIDLLEEFYRRLKEVVPEDVYVLGDVLEYGRNVEDHICMNIVRERKSQMVAGNHEGFAVLRYLTNRSEANTASVIDIDDMLLKESIEFIGSLQDRIEEGEMMFAHSIPDNGYKIETTEDAVGGFKYLAEEHSNIRLCFIGHSHEPACYYDKDGKTGSVEGDSIELRPEGRYIINPGALENGNYLLFDSEQGVLARCNLLE